MATYNLKYFAEIHNFRGQLARVEILQRSNSAFSVLEIGDVCGLTLEIQGATEDIYTPVVKTSARLSMISCDDKPTEGGIKYGGWQEFYTPDDTLYKLVIKTKPTPSASSWTTRWTGYITPDSWQEGLEYRGAITITARDNIGHLQDFEFDMPANNIYNLATLRSIISAAAAKIFLPMNLVFSQADAIEDENGDEVLDAYVNLDKFSGRDWYSVLSDVLDAVGYTLRYTDKNNITVAPLRYLPLLGEADEQDQPQMSDLEFFGGSGEIVPAVKQITETHSFDYDGAISIPVADQEHMTYGAEQMYRCSWKGIKDSNGQKKDKPEHDAPYHVLQNVGNTAWVTGSQMLNIKVPRRDETTNANWNAGSVAFEGEGWDNFAVIPANCTESSLKTASLRFYCGTPDVTLKATFTAVPVGIDGYGDWMSGGHKTRYIMRRVCGMESIRYYVKYEKGNLERYWTGSSWVATPVPITKEFNAEQDTTTEIEIPLGICEEIPSGGYITLTFDRIVYKCYEYLPGMDGDARGIYARLGSLTATLNKENLSKNTIKTINNESYNVMLNRDTVISPLSRSTPVARPSNYPTALYRYDSDGLPEPFPYEVNWHGIDGVVKPLPVLVHQQILCYRGASLWELSGECAPKNRGLFWFDSLCHYKNRTYILQSGTLDFVAGTIHGVVLREFLEYDDIWDDTEQGDWSDVTEYPNGESSPQSSIAGGSGGSGGGGGASLMNVWRSLTNNDELDAFDENTKIAWAHIPSYFEEDGQGGIKLKDQYNGLWAAGYGSFGGQNSSGGGGGGGVDLDRVWDSLTNNTDKPNVKINVAHIPNLEIGNINGLTEALAAAGGAKSLTVGNVNYQPDANGIISIPAYPTALASPYALTFGSKTYNGSEAKTITASDLGALTAVPKATDSVIGGFQTGYAESGKNYAVQMSGNKAFVNVPWTDTVYSLPLAANGTRGGIQVGFSESNSGSSSDRNYAVKLSSEKAYVNVPWTDTVYTHPTNGANTTISAANGKVLSAITVNNLGHVTSVSSKTLATADIPDLSGTYLPLTGGTLTGDLRLKTGGTAYGSKLNIGDGDYVYLHEDTDDHLKMYASKGFEIATSGGSYGIKFGDGVLKWDSTNQAWHLEGNFYADGFVTAGGLGSENTQLVTLGGAQTITGAKTFTGTLTISGTGNTFTTAVTFQQHVTFGTINVGSIAFNGSGTTPGITNTLDRIYIQRTGQTGVSMCAANGMVVIGALSAGSGVTTPKLYVAGDALATGAWNTSSDGRLKDEIEAIHSDRALAVLMQLKPREWVWNKNNAAMCGKRGAGFVAQDVLEVLPWAVLADGGYMGLNYQALHAYEVAGLQNHEARIAELERRLNNGA